MARPAPSVARPAPSARPTVDRPSIDPAPPNRQRARLRAVVLSGWAALFLLACAPAPLRVPPAPAPQAAPPAAVLEPAQTALSALVAAERAAAAARDLPALAALWSEDAEVRERRSADASGDFVWSGRDAVLDRYIVAVFPNPPPPRDGALPPPQVAGDRATLVDGVDSWRFVRRDDRWWIAGLTIDSR